MTGEHFINYLEDPNQLALVNYEELRTLALAYPYAHNLRYLLAFKARLEDKPEYPKLLAAAAAYSLDRRRLLALVRTPKVVPAPITPMREEVLELKPLTDVLQKLELQKQEREVSALAAQALTRDHTLPKPEERPATPPPSRPNKEQLPIEDPYADWLATFRPTPLVNPDESPSQNQNPKLNAELQETTISTDDVISAPDASAPSRPAPAPKSLAQQLAERSVTPNEEVVSETLARLLARQGHIDRAIAMYKKLSLQYPEKSATFAALIKALKN